MKRSLYISALLLAFGTTISVSTTEAQNSSNEESLTHRASFLYDQHIAAGSDDAYEYDGGGKAGIVHDATDTEIYVGIPSWDEEAGFRFVNVNIPPFATIDNATMYLDNSVGSADVTSVNIYAEDNANPVAFSNSNKIGPRTRTSAFVEYNINWSGGENGTATPDIATVIQEAVFNNGGLNDLVLIFSENGSSDDEVSIWTYERSQSESARLVINYSVSDNPIAFDDESHGYDNITNNIDVLENDIDPLGLALSISITAPPSNGTAFVRPDNTIDYSPNSGFAGTDQLTYEVCNTTGLCSTATLTITVGGQAVTMEPGSYIVNMGVQPQTEANALKPYGMVYELTTQYSVPIDWVINPTKVKDGVDFNYNGVDYKGGPFIIREEHIDATVMSVISTWEGRGVVGTYTTSSLVVPVDKTIDYFMGWTLDAQNGDIAEEYLNTAGIPSSAYNWLEPAELGCCNDVFVMPHADPTWADHSNLLNWNDDGANGGCDGTIFAACHAVSALENLFNPSNPSEQMNFLSEKTGIATGNDDYADNSLILWNDHDDGSAPFQYENQTHPEMQFMGGLDESLTNGSEEIFIPHTQWRPETVIGGWDPDNDEVSGNQVAAVLAYGPAFGDPTKGKVMYMAGHRHDGRNDPDYVAAQRAFFNFSFNAAIEKSIRLGTGILPASSTLTQFEASEFSVVASGGTGAGYIYSWSSSCGGMFSDPTSATTNFTPYTSGVCVITCEVSDACGRRSFSSVPYTVELGCNNGILNFDKTVGADTVLEGNSITYTYSFNNQTGAALHGISFQDLLTNGLTWASEPFNFSGGIACTGAPIIGSSNASKVISTLPVGISSFDISVDIPKPYSGGRQFISQAQLGGLPAIFNGSVYSDVSVACVYEPSVLVILTETDCIGNWNIPNLSADFAFDHKSADVTATRPMINVVLHFSDGTTQMFAAFGANANTYSGTGIHEDKCIVGVWIRSACNASGEGPGYGEYVVSPIWDGLCVDPDPVIQVISVHFTTVNTSGDGPQIHIGDIDLEPGTGTGTGPGSGGSGSSGHGGVGVPSGPPIFHGPVRGGFREMEVVETSDLSIYPNPARGYQTVNIKGLNNGDWTLEMFSISGQRVASILLDGQAQLNLSSMDLKTGLYFLELRNGSESISERIVVYE